MVRLPHDVFRYILSFKDPRYERARSSHYLATPTRVWYTYDEHRKMIHPEPPHDVLYFYHGPPPILRQGPERQLPEENWATPSKVHITVFEKSVVEYDEWSERRFRGFIERSGPRLDETSLQCEACGPDLELYEMMRR